MDADDFVFIVVPKYQVVIIRPEVVMAWQIIKIVLKFHKADMMNGKEF